MSPNMSYLDRALRTLLALAAIAVAALVGASSLAAIVLFAFAAVMLATSAIGFCGLYRLLHIDSRGRRPLTH